MATIVLPVTPQSPRFGVLLEGAQYVFAFSWNARAGAWFFSLFDASGSPLAQGRKVVLGAPLAWRSRDPRLPPGMIMAVDTSGQDAEAGESDLGARVQLVYVESSGSDQ